MIAGNGGRSRSECDGKGNRRNGAVHALE